MTRFTRLLAGAALAALVSTVGVATAAPASAADGIPYAIRSASL